MGMTCKTRPSLCWDCANATGTVCCWANYGKPVDGWLAEKTKKASYDTEEYGYLVIDCPLFIRDAVRGGLYRYRKGDLVCDSTSGLRGK